MRHPSKKDNGKRIALQYHNDPTRTITGTYTHRDRSSAFELAYDWNGEVLNGVFDRDEWIVSANIK